MPFAQLKNAGIRIVIDQTGKKGEVPALPQSFIPGACCLKSKQSIGKQTLRHLKRHFRTTKAGIFPDKFSK